MTVVQIAMTGVLFLCAQGFICSGGQIADLWWIPLLASLLVILGIWLDVS